MVGKPFFSFFPPLARIYLFSCFPLFKLIYQSSRSLFLFLVHSSPIFVPFLLFSFPIVIPPSCSLYRTTVSSKSSSIFSTLLYIYAPHPPQIHRITQDIGKSIWPLNYPET